MWQLVCLLPVFGSVHPHHPRKAAHGLAHGRHEAGLGAHPKRQAHVSHASHEPAHAPPRRLSSFVAKEPGDVAADVQAAVAGSNEEDAKQIAATTLKNVDHIAKDETEWRRTSNKELDDWERNDAPKTYAHLNDVKHVQEAVEKVAEHAIQVAAQVKTEGFADSEAIGAKLGELNDQFMSIAKMAERRHEQAAVSVSHASQMMEMAQEARGVEEVELVTDESTNKLTQIELAEERIQEKKERIMHRLQTTIANLNDIAGNTRAGMIDDWQKVMNALSHLQDEEAEHEQNARDLKDEHKKMERDLDHMDRDAAKLAQKQVNEFGNAAFASINAIQKETKKSFGDAEKTALNDIKALGKEQTGNAKEVRSEAMELQKATVMYLMAFGLKESKAHAEAKKLLATVTNMDKRAAVQLEAEQQREEDVTRESREGMDDAMKRTNGQVQKEMDAIEASGQNQQRVMGALEEETNDAVKREGARAVSDLDGHAMDLTHSFGSVAMKQMIKVQDHVKQLGNADASLTGGQADREHLDEVIADNLKILKEKLKTLELAFSKEVRSRSSATAGILKEVEPELEESVSSADSELGDADRIAKRSADQAQRRTADKAKDAVDAITDQARKYTTDLSDMMPFHAAAEQMATKATQALKLKIDRLNELLLPSMGRLEKAEDAVHGQVESETNVYADEVKELKHIMVDGENGVMQYALKYGSKMKHDAGTGMKADLADVIGMQKHIDNAIALYDAANAASNQQVSATRQHASGELLAFSNQLNAAKAEASAATQSIGGEVRDEKTALSEKQYAMRSAMEEQLNKSRAFPEKFNAMLAEFAQHIREQIEAVEKKYKDMEEGAKSSDELDADGMAADKAKNEANAILAELSELVGKMKSAEHMEKSAESTGERALSESKAAIEREAKAAGMEAEQLASELSAMNEGQQGATRTALNGASGAVDAAGQRAGEFAETKADRLQTKADNAIKNAKNEELLLDEKMGDDMHRMDRAAGEVESDVERFDQASKSNAEDISSETQEAAHDGAANGDEEKQRLQGVQNHMNSGMDTEIGTNAKIADGLGKLAKASEDTIAADQQDWDTEVEQSTKGVNDGYRKAAHDAMIAKEESDTVAKQGEQTEKNAKAALESAIRTMSNDGTPMEQELARLHAVVTGQEGDQTKDIAGERGTFEEKLNGRLGDFSGVVESFVQQVNAGKQLEEASLAKQAEFAKKLQVGQSLEVVHDHEDVDSLHANEQLLSYEMNDFDKWLNRFKENDKRFNTKLFEKLNSMSLNVNSSLFNRQMGLSVEKTELEGEEQAIGSAFRNALDKAHLDEQTQLAAVSAGSDRLLRRLQSATNINEMEKAKLMQAIQQSADHLESKIKGQQGSLEDMNAEIAKHIERFDAAITLAERMSKQLSGEGTASEQVDEIISGIADKFAAMKTIPLFHASPKTSLAEVDAGDGAERNLRSLQREDAQLEKANTELAAEIEQAERRLF